MTQAQCLVTSALGLLSIALAPSAPAGEPQAATTVYVGTYTDAGSRGIYRFSLDLATGSASAPVLAAESENPSFLALHPSGRFLYAVNEV
jgi:6-phosphogluconolactonase